MKFRIGNAEACVHIGVLPFLFWCVIAGETRTLLLTALSLSVHEAAHWIAARNLKLSVSRLTVYPFGAVMRLDSLTLFDGAEAIVAAAGPIGSLTVSGMMTLFESAVGEQPWTGELMRINLLIALLNLLPAYPLDGGRIFRSLLLRTVSERTAKRLLLAFTGLIALVLLSAGVVLTLRGAPNVTLFCLPPFLLLAAVQEWRLPDAGILNRVMERRTNLRAGEAQRAELMVISDACSIGEAMRSIRASRYTILRVQTGSGFYELDENALIRAAAKFGVQTPLKFAISRLTLPH